MEKITNEDLMKIWHTKTINAFHTQNFDDILYPTNIIGTETYIVTGSGDNKKHVEGYVVTKKHKNESTNTIYFLRTQDVELLPLKILKTTKIHSKGGVYNLLTCGKSIKITPQKDMNWRELVEQSGIPMHSEPMHHALYKNKVLYARLKGQMYYRVITESAFGKDKYKEALRLLLDSSCNLSDPSTAKLFFSVCHTRDLTINELPKPEKKDFIKFCNALMRIGDAATILDNSSRKTEGTYEVAHIENLSTSFIHNIPKYYHDRGEDSFEDIYPYNVINRYFYTLYEGFLQAQFPSDMDYIKIAEEYTPFLRRWIKSALWYEEHWHELKNLYPNVDLSKFHFKSKENRFKDHFIDFARCLSHYAETEAEYKVLLNTEYQCHDKYRNIIEPASKEGKLV